MTERMFYGVIAYVLCPILGFLLGFLISKE